MVRSHSRIARDPRRLAPTATAALLAAVYLLWQPPSLDLAAAEYRAWLFGHAGFAVWDAQWYGGHHLPGYSVLFPPLAWALGPRLLGALCVVAAAGLFERIAHERYRERAWLGATWFALGAGATLFSGRITFALGLVPALAAVLALQRGRRAAALALALLTPLASPVAALFLALAGAAYALARRRALGIAVAVAALAPVALLAAAFPEGGTEPFVFSAFWPALAFAAIALVLTPRAERTLRIGVALYALAATATFLIDTPIGGNVMRLGALAAGPAAALVLWRRRTLALALLAPFLLWWQCSAAVHDVRTASGDASVHAAYYAPLLAELGRLDATASGTGARLEIPFTRLHWEARWVAPAIPLARGWERQLDVARNAVFYAHRGRDGAPLTAARYEAWLHDDAVSWVALPDARLDYSAKAEARLIEHGLPYLRRVWRGAHWRLYAVDRPAPLADPPARVVRAGTDALTLAVPRPAAVRLRARWTPYWAVTRGDACVEPDGDWTRLDVRRAGIVQLAVRFSPLRIGAHAARCANGPS
jgi:hypothetical protein